MSLTKLSLTENNDVKYKLFPPRESLVSDISVGDGNIEKLFLRCRIKCDTEKNGAVAELFICDSDEKFNLMSPGYIKPPLISAGPPPFLLSSL
jgi:hypothetical protein